MASQGWLCRRVRCGMRNDPKAKKCFACGGLRPKKRVVAHKKASRDVTYEQYLKLNEEIHGVGEVCAVCGRERSQHRKLDRDHDHTTGEPRGLTCVGDNILMPPKMTAAKAQQIADYLQRVEDHYGHEQALDDEETLLALQKLQEECMCGEINMRHCPVHQDAA
jgi:hypothetical protein